MGVVGLDGGGNGRDGDGGGDDGGATEEALTAAASALLTLSHQADFRFQISCSREGLERKKISDFRF